MGVSNSILIKDVKIFDGTKIIERGHVFVVDGKIAQVGKGDFNGELSTGITVISKPGDTLMPGLIDAHIHALSGNVDSIEQSLRFGVTTVCDMHNDPKDNAKLRKLASEKANKSKYADFKCAGLGAVVQGGWPGRATEKESANTPCGNRIVDEIASRVPMLCKPEDAEPFVKQQIEESGASYIKTFHELGDSLGTDLPQPPIDIQKAVVAAAYKHGVATIGHAFSYAGAMELLRAGVDGLSHMFLDEPPSDVFVQLMLDNDAHCNPALGLCASQTDEGQEAQLAYFRDPLAQKALIQKEPTKPLGLAAGQKPQASVANAYSNTRALYKAGVPIIVGTDAAGKGLGLPYGLGMHMEMRVLVKEVGMSPIDVLKSATSITAERLKFHDRGTIEPGKRADLVLVQGDVVEILAEEEGKCIPIYAVWREGILASAV
ncbi:Imidazolonepropionase [Colletotrichum orbiculare MAFF 240422]|uniref:Imidazolonepropionase n=1 Tax=Colletotrichum orbiculare (strain 104-T / ATCC 96160 / CBS 514.97 / LARS 414 / MAFF 240422) TaxID=1213857 RepID=N4W071_COLOR|nr:Imidazolonepropionase [Colletotrichum orbiculare MAFF 240422]